MNLQVPLMEMLLGCDIYPCCCFKGSRGTTGTSAATDVKEKNEAVLFYFTHTYTPGTSSS